MHRNEPNCYFYRATFMAACSTLIIFMVLLAGCTREKKAPVPETKGMACILFDKLPLEVANPLDVNFDNRVKLMGIRIDKKSQEQMEISYYWQATKGLAEFKKVFVHFTDAGNNVLFQNDHDFCPKRSIDELKGKVVGETFSVSIPASARGQEIYVKLGLYDPAPNGQRLKILSAGTLQLDEKDTRVSVEKIKL